MAIGAYIGAGGRPAAVKEIYIGVNNKPAKVKEGYIGVDNKPCLFYQTGTAKANRAPAAPMANAISREKGG